MADKRELLFSFIGKETISPAAKKAGDAVDKLGDEFKATSDDAKKLDREIDQAKGGLRDLAAQFARTDDAAKRLDLSKAMRQQQSELRKLTKAKGLLPDFDEEGKKGAASFAASFASKLGSAPLAPVVAAMAPTLAAGVAGAVVGGAGVGGVVGGVILAARDERVKEAGSKLGEFILGDLEKRAAGFVPEVLEGIGRIQSAWKDMGPDLERVFHSSRLVQPLLDGLLSGGKKLIHGIADAVDKADPVVDALGRSFDAIGDSAGDFFTTLSGDAKEGASAIDDLTNSIVNLMDTVTVVTHYGAQIKGASDDLDVLLDKGRYWIEDNSWLAEKLRAVGVELDITADGFAKGSKEAEAYRAATLGTATAADFATLKQAGMTDAWIASKDASGTYRQKLDEVKAATQTGTGAIKDQTAALDELAAKLRAQTDPTFALIDAQTNLKDAQKGYNEAVKEHGEKSPEAEAALRKMAQAAIAVQGAAGAAAGTFDGKLTPAMKATLKSAGFTDAEIANLEKQFKTAMAAGDKFAKDYHADVFVDWHYRTFGKPGTSIGGIGGKGFKGMAGGGPIVGRGPKGVDSEPRVLAPGEFVLDDKTVDALGGFAGVEKMRSALRGGKPASPPMATAGGGSAGGVIVTGPIYVQANDPEEFLDKLRKQIKTRGGNVQAVLGA